MLSSVHILTHWCPQQPCEPDTTVISILSVRTYLSIVTDLLSGRAGWETKRCRFRVYVKEQISCPKNYIIEFYASNKLGGNLRKRLLSDAWDKLE